MAKFATNILRLILLRMPSASESISLDADARLSGEGAGRPRCLRVPKRAHVQCSAMADDGEVIMVPYPAELGA